MPATLAKRPRLYDSRNSVRLTIDAAQAPLNPASATKAAALKALALADQRVARKSASARRG